MKQFEKITHVRCPFDLRDPEPKKNYGIHALDVWFILKGPKGAVQFGVTFPAYLPHVRRELERKPDPYGSLTRIRGFDVGYHAKEAQFEGHSPMKCEMFGECYYDGSSLRADAWAEEIFEGPGRPEDEIWKRLEEEYISRFGDPGFSKEGL